MDKKRWRMQECDWLRVSSALVVSGAKPSIGARTIITKDVVIGAGESVGSAAVEIGGHGAVPVVHCVRCLEC